MGEIGGSNVIDRPVQSQLFAGQLLHVFSTRNACDYHVAIRDCLFQQPVKVTLDYMHGDLGHGIQLRR